MTGVQTCALPISFYVNSPFGLVLGHNGNLTNTDQLKSELFRQDLRHVNTNSDSEVLLNVLAHELQDSASNYKLDPATIFKAVSGVHRRCRGAYAVVVVIAGYGLLAFRDPFGIRPLVYGKLETDFGTEYLVASESVALDALGFEVVRDIAPGELYGRGMAVAQQVEPLLAQIRAACPPAADGVLIGGTGFRCVGIVEQLEQDLRRPVVSANQASLWHCLRRSGVHATIDGYGSLLRKP